MGYDDLSAEEKLQLAIDFVARGQTLPNKLVEFLKAEGLYDAITQPVPDSVAA